jgi:RNA 3'-terminal phosphate cyclase (ATP)
MKSTPLLPLSGESGGGQILRSALTLSAITGQPFRITNIRGKRPKPGLMRQHLTCVKAAAEICDGTVDGAEIGSIELVFSPGKVRGGDYSFAIGSGGSTTLVLQTLLPALLHAGAASTLRIEGGTHNPMAPPFDFIDQCYLPLLKSMGARANVILERPGFMQAGGGVLSATINPLKKWKKLKLTDRGEPVGTFGRVLHAHLAREIADREIKAAAKILDWPGDQFEIVDAADSAGPGNAILLGTRFANVCEISSGIAAMGRSAESVGVAAAKGLRNYLASSAPVGVHLADQLLLPIALAGGGVFHTMAITNHMETNIAVIEKFLPVQFVIDSLERGVKCVTCRARIS